MALPTSREEFKQWCLRSLGKPVIDINVSDEQCEDRIDEALQYYWDYHFDGTEKLYYKYQVTAEDKTNKYITLPENIIGAVRIFNPGGAIGSSNLFNIRYQIALNDLYTLTNVSLLPYYMAMQHIRVIEEVLVGQKPIRYVRHRDRLHVDMDWNDITTGNYLVVEAYQIVDPTEFPDVWKDRWLLEYATVLIKRQWGSHLKKFGNVSLLGGVVMNGKEIYEEADQRIKQLEAEMITSYSLPTFDFIG